MGDVVQYPNAVFALIGSTLLLGLAGILEKSQRRLTLSLGLAIGLILIAAAASFKVSMVRGVETGVDAAFFIGYHARAGSLHGILDHTWSSRRVHNLWINGYVSGQITRCDVAA